MKFTDEDLKRLKEESSAEDYSGYHQVTIYCDDLDSLLHRLECAEAFIETHPCTSKIPHGTMDVLEMGCAYTKEWRSSKGER